jgi:hypothetical protein
VQVPRVPQNSEQTSLSRLVPHEEDPLLIRQLSVPSLASPEISSSLAPVYLSHLGLCFSTVTLVRITQKGHVLFS